MTPIVPGEVFIDKSGQVAQLHGVGIDYLDGRFYAWGEDKSAGTTFTAVGCYSSGDLAKWRFEGYSLMAGTDPGDLGPDRVVERPKVLRRPDGVYVMLLHIDSADYAAARVGFASADNPVGPYTYLGSERPLGNLSRDIGVYHEDGAGYLLSEDRDHGLHIYSLAADYLSVAGIVSTTRKDDGTHGYESPALIKHEDLYYLFGSDLTGWSTNDNKYTVSPSLAGPWGPWHDFAPAGSSTFDSQVSTVVVNPTGGPHPYVFIGDRWRPRDLANSAPVWLPLSVGGGLASIAWRDRWALDGSA